MKRRVLFFAAFIVLGFLIYLTVNYLFLLPYFVYENSPLHSASEALGAFSYSPAVVLPKPVEHKQVIDVVELAFNGSTSKRAYTEGS